jgi:hypothetical protein
MSFSYFLISEIEYSFLPIQNTSHILFLKKKKPQNPQLHLVTYPKKWIKRFVSSVSFHILFVVLTVTMRLNFALEQSKRTAQKTLKNNYNDFI